jgi:hypothetical protein
MTDASRSHQSSRYAMPFAASIMIKLSRARRRSGPYLCCYLLYLQMITICFSTKDKFTYRKISEQQGPGRYVLYCILHSVERLYCKRPILCLASFKILTPHLWCGGRTHSLGGEGGGGSIFWQTPDTALSPYF